MYRRAASVRASRASSVLCITANSRVRDVTDDRGLNDGGAARRYLCAIVVRENYTLEEQFIRTLED